MTICTFLALWGAASPVFFLIAWALCYGGSGPRSNTEADDA